MSGTLESGRRYPRSIILIAVGGICVGLALSALFTFKTLNGLRREFLESRGQDIVRLVERQVRGPGRRNNPELWQRILDETLESNRESITYLRLTDSEGTVIASAGFPTPGEGTADGQAYVYEGSLAAPRGPRWDSEPGGPGPGPGSGQGGPARLEVGLVLEATEFLTRQAYIQLGVAGAAILLLAGLAAYLLRTLDRYLALRAVEASQRHLAQLGQMAATLAHEIRNPLGAMKGLTQLVQEDLAEDDRNRELTQTVVSEAGRLEKLVTDLLNFARPRTVDAKPVALDRLAADVSRFLSSRAETAEVRIEQEPRGTDVTVQGDADGLRQVLINVLSNAIEAAPPGTSVEVELDTEGSLAQIRVLDRGPGVGPGDPEDLFQPFNTTKTQGSGLGLAISRQIVEAHRGTIVLENRPNGGAICRISLPRG